MSEKVLLSPESHGTNAPIGFNFYYEEVGFGDIIDSTAGEKPSIFHVGFNDRGPTSTVIELSSNRKLDAELAVQLIVGALDRRSHKIKYGYALPFDESKFIT